jgi:hypothetical protein
VTTRLRRGVAGALLVLLVGAAGVSACGDDDSGSGGKAPSTTRSEDAPEKGPQSGTNPAGGEPVPGSTPANG